MKHPFTFNIKPLGWGIFGSLGVKNAVKVLSDIDIEAASYTLSVRVSVGGVYIFRPFNIGYGISRYRALELVAECKNQYACGGTTVLAAFALDMERKLGLTPKRRGPAQSLQLSFKNISPVDQNRLIQVIQANDFTVVDAAGSYDKIEHGEDNALTEPFSSIGNSDLKQDIRVFARSLQRSKNQQPTTSTKENNMQYTETPTHLAFSTIEEFLVAYESLGALAAPRIKALNAAGGITLLPIVKVPGEAVIYERLISIINASAEKSAANVDELQALTDRHVRATKAFQDSTYSLLVTYAERHALLDEQADATKALQEFNKCISPLVFIKGVIGVECKEQARDIVHKANLQAEIDDLLNSRHLYIAESSGDVSVTFMSELVDEVKQAILSIRCGLPLMGRFAGNYDEKTGFSDSTVKPKAKRAPTKRATAKATAATTKTTAADSKEKAVRAKAVSKRTK